MDLKDYDRVNGEDLWQVIRMHYMDDKLMNRIKSIYVNSSPIQE